MLFMNEIILRARNISISFPGVKALDGVHVDIKKGSVHALCGENGAGKSTLLKILTGIYQRSGGEIYLDDKPVEISSITDARRFGIHVVPQELQMEPDLSVAENIFIGQYPVDRLGVISWKKLYQDAYRLQEKLGSNVVSLDLKAKVRTLRMGQRQLIEVMRGMIDDNIRILAFDEPSAALSAEETGYLFRLIRELREKGIAIIYVSHRLNEIFEICDEVTVLKDGKYIATHNVKDVNTDDIIRLMIGREIDLFGKAKDRTSISNEVMLKIEEFSNQSKFNFVSFEVRRGEILGLYGLIGAGRTEVLRSLFGLDERESGDVYIRGKKVSISNPREAKKYGLGFVTEDRRSEGLILGASLARNVSMPNLAAVCNKAGLISRQKEAVYARESISRFTIKATDENVIAGNLSGGNQQKTIIAKWVQANCDIMLFDEPTRGIDVGAKTEVYTAMKTLACSGKAIVMVSSELPEVLGISDRIIVMRDGIITANMENNHLKEEDVIQYAVRSVVNQR
jgi:ribose transport system ATP-binding protein